MDEKSGIKTGRNRVKNTEKEMDRLTREGVPNLFQLTGYIQ